MNKFIEYSANIISDSLHRHRRIWAVGMIMKVRLEVLKQKKSEQYKLAKRYFEFLSERTKMNKENRYQSVFII